MRDVDLEELLSYQEKSIQSLSNIVQYAQNIETALSEAEGLLQDQVSKSIFVRVRDTYGKIEKISEKTEELLTHYQQRTRKDLERYWELKGGNRD